MGGTAEEGGGVDPAPPGGRRGATMTVGEAAVEVVAEVGEEAEAEAEGGSAGAGQEEGGGGEH